MKTVLASMCVLLAASACEIRAATDVQRLAITSPEKASMKDDLGQENPKWKFIAGQWTRRPSGGRQVLAQVVETQPWAVALLEDQKFDDVDATVRFRPISGKEDASGGVIVRAKEAKTTCWFGPMPSRTTSASTQSCAASAARSRRRESRSPS